eukprot:932995-Lingulodinium_polyedra.AAC.1
MDFADVASVFEAMPGAVAAEAEALPGAAAAEASADVADALSAEDVRAGFEAAEERPPGPKPKRQRLGEGPLGEGRWQRARLGCAFMFQ